MNVKVLTWDWEENIDAVIEGFRDALREFGISVIEIDTQSDAIAVVIGNVTREEADRIYKEQNER